MKYFLALIILFIALCVCFRYWIDTRVYTAFLCKHSAMTTAVLHSKTPLGCCCWFVGDSEKCSESWFNCGEIEVGQVIPWEYINYSCDDLVESLSEKSPLEDWLYSLQLE